MSNVIDINRGRVEDPESYDSPQALVLDRLAGQIASEFSHFDYVRVPSQGLDPETYVVLPGFEDDQDEQALYLDGEPETRENLEWVVESAAFRIAYQGLRGPVGSPLIPEEDAAIVTALPFLIAGAKALAPALAREVAARFPEVEQDEEGR